MREISLPPPKKLFDYALRVVANIKSLLLSAFESLKKGVSLAGILSAAVYAVAALALLALVLIQYPSYLKPLWPSGYDTFGHLAKVEFFSKMISQFGAYADWGDEWYAGYHPLLFYPPLSYAFPVALRLLGLSSNVVARISVLGGVWIAGLSAYLMGLALLQPAKGIRAKLLPLLAAVAFMTAPGVVALQMVAGEFADFWAAVIAPLAVASLIMWLEKRKVVYLIFLAFSTSAVFLMHGHVATPLAVGMLLAAFLFDLVDHKWGERRGFKGFFGVLLAIAIFAGLTAFWWLPYFQESPLLALPDMVSIKKTALPLHYLLTKSLEYGTPRYLGIATLIFAIAGVALGNWKRVVIMLSLGLVGLVTYLGPSWDFYARIPVLGLVFAERAIPTLAIAISGLSLLALEGALKHIERLLGQIKALAAKTKLVKIIAISMTPTLGVMIAAAILVDNSFLLEESRAKPMSSDFLELNKRLESLPKPYGARVAFVPSPALASYSPVLSGWPTLDGYLVQGSRLSTEFEWVMTNELASDDRRSLHAALKRWNVAYLAINHYAEREANEALSNDSAFSKVYSNRYHTLYRFTPAPGYLAPVKSVVIVGDPRYIRQTLERSADALNQQILFAKEGTGINSSDHFDTIIFPGGPIPDGFEEALEKRVKDGANAVVNLDGSETSSFLNVKVREARYNGQIQMINFTGERHEADATYMGNPWDTVTYKGLDEVHLSSDKKALAGIKRLGKGRILFVGFNAFYHAAYKGDEWEKRELVRMFEFLDGGAETGVKASFSFIPNEINPSEKSFALEASKGTSVLLSSGWSYYWKAYLDGKEIPLQKAQNLSMFYMPAGRHRLDLKLSTWSLPKFLGVAVSFTTTFLVCAALYVAKRRRLDIRPAE